MQNKGAIRLVAILLSIACLYQLSFTAVSALQNRKAEKAAVLAAASIENPAEQIAVRDAYKKSYLDSLSDKKIYLGYTYKEILEKEINLGLDLKGGMNVTLQVQLEDLVNALASNQNMDFQTAFAKAKEMKMNDGSGTDFITLFGQAWKATTKNPLNQVFGSAENAASVNAKTTDDEVITWLKSQAESAINNSFNVLRNRIDRFGVTQPNIQKLGNSGKILVELPGVKEPERVRKLLQGTASLEFWPTFGSTDYMDGLQRAAEQIYSTDSVNLFQLIIPAQSSSALIGWVNYTDTAKVNSLLSRADVKRLFKSGFTPMLSAKPSDMPGFNSGTMFELVAINASTGKAPLDGDAVTDARVEFGNNGAAPNVSMNMNSEGAQIWAQLTKQNIGKQIAIVLDGAVYSYPNVQNAIEGGSSQITGNFTPEEAEDLANVLKSGKLPAPAKIVEEAVVGPTLGAKSISAGLLSFVIAFLLVLIYMICFYSGAGIVADIALLCNVLFLFGTLSSFGAVLTLPGIAGLVLTLGMAVDANVIIYERIKEELLAGKALNKAIADGYKNAYSAIIDGQITTILTGIVLFIFGKGAVQGFATTLIIGIVTSVITSIFITRIIFDDRLAKGKGIKFDNKFTRDFLQHTKFDFIGKKKIAYIVSGCLIVVSLLSMAIKGFTYGVDFTGGHTYTVNFDQAVTTEEIRTAVLAEFEGSSAEVKQFGGENQMKITTQYKVNESSDEVNKEIEGKLYNALSGFFANPLTLEEFSTTDTVDYGIVSSESVGPTIANETKTSAIYSVLIALFVIFAYIAVRFKGWTWGLGGVVSLAHTAIIVIGFFSIFTGILPFTLDVDQTFIAAVLTIIGYAINDNVVIFDRIREYRINHPKAELKENVNQALNSTLSRTLNTSLTTLITMLAIAIFGGEVIRGLAVALIVGIVVGTYASIFIGTPIMYDVTLAAEKKKAAKVRK